MTAIGYWSYLAFGGENPAASVRIAGSWQELTGLDRASGLKHRCDERRRVLMVREVAGRRDSDGLDVGDTGYDAGP